MCKENLDCDGFPILIINKTADNKSSQPWLQVCEVAHLGSELNVNMLTLLIFGILACCRQSTGFACVS